MPDNTPKPGFADPAKNNADVAQKLLAQDISGQSMAPTANTDTSSALDALAEKKAKEKEGGGDPNVQPKGDDAAAKAAADKAAADKAAADKAAADKAAADKAAKGGTPPADDAAAKAAAEAAEKAKADDEVKKKADEIFKDAPSLPPNASPKSSEAFSTVKIKAAQEISAREQKIAELEKKLKEATEKLKDPVPAETAKELEELRSFRARLDVEADPKFKSFDKEVEQTREFIYAQLKKSPVVSDDTIEKIKKIGGPEMVDLGKLFEAIKDPALQAIVERKITDIEQTKWKKEELVKSTKANISQYLKERQTAYEQAVNGHQKATSDIYDQLASKLDWMKEKKADDKTDAKVAEEHNKFVAEIKQQIDIAKTDDSPEMRAILLASMAQLLNLQRVHEATKASDTAKIADLQKQLDEANSKIERFKSASVSRLREGGAAPNSKPTPPKEQTLNTHTGDALDKIRDQIMQQKAAASGQG